jgi:hypothetical protein
MLSARSGQLGDGFCAGGTCKFITASKVAYDVPCTNDGACPNGPLGAGDYVIGSRCETPARRIWLWVLCLLISTS